MELIFPQDKKDTEAIGDVVFYAETLRIVDMYLREFHDGIPSKSLQLFVEAQSSSSLVNKIAIENSNGLFSKENATHVEFVTNSERKLFFIEEIRFLILSSLIARRIKNRILLKKLHLYIHLLELHFIEEMTLFEKVNAFLNTNFKLRNDDFKGHACRGNFGELVRIKPELSKAIEAYISIKNVKDIDSIQVCKINIQSANTEDIQTKLNSDNNTADSYQSKLMNWASQYNIDENLFKILSGLYYDFDNELEKFCYDLIFKEEFTIENEFIAILKGNFDELLEKSDGWLRLIILLIHQKSPLKEYEKVFESLCYETFNLDYLTSLDFLAYSRSCSFHFNILINKIQLNSVSVESLIRFTVKNKIENDLLLSKFTILLQSACEYDTLCRFLLNHSIRDFDYSENFLKYFVSNFERFKFSVDDKFLDDFRFKFVHKLFYIKTCDLVSLEFLVSHFYFKWFVNEIVNGMLVNRNTDENLIFKCLGIIMKIETQTGASFKVEKGKLAESFSK